ncbi:MAG: ribose 5-phosphate isomerase B [Bacteroidota bacterium]|nr:ribose 5-phosphate isomerase B [Bacteroidota bacterium]
MKKILHIGCDHAGFDLKQELISLLSNQNYELKDHGCFTKDSMDYPDVVHPLANAVEQDSESLGILICGSGNGVCLTANKHQGIRAALCWLPELGALARQHNNANILCLPARFISSEQAKEIVSAYLNAEFEGGRHQNRVNKVAIG